MDYLIPAPLRLAATLFALLSWPWALATILMWISDALHWYRMTPFQRRIYKRRQQRSRS